MPKLICIFGLASLALATFPGGMRAQEAAAPGQTQTTQGNTSDALLSQSEQTTNNSAADLYSYSDGRSFVLPSINLTTQLRSDSSGLGNDSLRAQTYVLGRLALRRVSARSEFMLDYVGGGRISTVGDGTSSAIHALELSRTISGRRTSLWLLAAGSYLSEASFGFNGFAGLDNSYHSGALNRVLAGTSAYLRDVTPDQTILTARVPRLSGTLGTRVEYKLSPRSSWTVAGSYGALRLSSPGYVSSGNVQVRTSYDYQVTRKNTVAVIYRFAAFRFAGLDQSVDEHAVWLSLARRMSSQWRLQIAAGPNVELFRARLSGPASLFGWGVNGSLTYQLQRTALRFSYDRGLTGGSGVLAGARTNQFQARVERTFTRRWQGSVAAAYARNEGLTQTVPGIDRASFQTWYGTAGLSRHLGTGSNLYVGYGVRSQRSYGALPSFATHEISLGFSWGFRSIALQ